MCLCASACTPLSIYVYTSFSDHRRLILYLLLNVNIRKSMCELLGLLVGLSVGPSLTLSVRVSVVVSFPSTFCLSTSKSRSEHAHVINVNKG